MSDKTKTEEELAAEETAKKQEYDKAQQQLDQERANARKAREQAAEATGRNAELESQVKDAKEQLVQMQEQLNRPKIDPDVADIPEVANYAKKLEAEILAQKEIVNDLQKGQEESKAKAADAEQKSQTEALQEMILNDCDEEFGSKFRNDALKLADELVNKGDVELPKTPYEGARLMRKCYKQLVEKQPKKKTSTPSDSGGSSVPAESGIEPGSRQDVLAQMRKNPSSWRGTG